MKKKTVKKLVLAKETVRSLQDGLKSVQGGRPPQTDQRMSDCEICTYSVDSYCITFEC